VRKSGRKKEKIITATRKNQIFLKRLISLRVTQQFKFRKAEFNIFFLNHHIKTFLLPFQEREGGRERGEEDSEDHVEDKSPTSSSISRRHLDGHLDRHLGRESSSKSSTKTKRITPEEISHPSMPQIEREIASKKRQKSGGGAHP